MRRGDVWLLIVVSAVGVGLLGQWWMSNAEAEAYDGNKYANISVDGKPYRTVELTEERQLIEVRTKFGYNLIQVQDGQVFMAEADCPDDLCILMGPKDRLGETIVCLPNRVIVEVVGDGEPEGGIDAIAN